MYVNIKYVNIKYVNNIKFIFFLIKALEFLSIKIKFRIIDEISWSKFSNK